MSQLPILLVITENPPIRYWIKKHLQEKYFIIDAHTMKKALDTIETSQLDLVILDDTFTDCDPIELCQKMRSLTDTFFPILLITGRLKRSFRTNAKKEGVTEFLSDQLDAQELEAKINSAKNTNKVEQKVSGLSSLIAKPLKTSPSFFENKTLQYPAKAMLIINAAPSEIKDYTVIPHKDYSILFVAQEDAQRIAQELQQTLQTSVVISKMENNESSFTKTIDAAEKALKSAKPSQIIDQEFLG